MLLSSNAYAGKIVGVDANAPYVATTPPTQHGFVNGVSGWNLDNVNVKITDLNYVEISKQFYPDGTYDLMDINDSFESEISSDGEIRGLLHGKDWPVGEPSGIKAVNDDNLTKHDKAQNCIMTTSYLETGYLNVPNPEPTRCSSDFQTHKRFKINMQPTTIADPDKEGYGQPVDLVFNLDPNDTNTSVRRYQVFQKINNYTSMRLDGYKIEVLDENGLPNENLKLSLTISSTEDDESGEDATFSHGLWGPYEEYQNTGEVKFDYGFFDDNRSGFKQVLSGTQVVIAGPTPLAGNYEDLFGTWLPSKWAPIGIFYDHDGNPLTDAKLEAFWGTAPDAADGTEPAWLTGQDYNLTDGDQSWTEINATELAELNISVEGSLYSYGVIEDTLNLGPNYVVEVGENAKIGKTFTIRITPRVAVDQTPPSYIDENGTYITPPGVPADLLPVDNTPDVPLLSNSDGGSCTFNPNSKGIDTTVLLMLALGMFYPFRRRFIQ